MTIGTPKQSGPQGYQFHFLADKPAELAETMKEKVLNNEYVEKYLTDGFLNSIF